MIKRIVLVLLTLVVCGHGQTLGGISTGMRST